MAERVGIICIGRITPEQKKAIRGLVVKHAKTIMQVNYINNTQSKVALRVFTYLNIKSIQYRNEDQIVYNSDVILFIGSGSTLPMYLENLCVNNKRTLFLIDKSGGIYDQHTAQRANRTDPNPG